MADLKTRPQMDRPKLRKQGAIPKEAAAILQQPFADRQQQRQPGQKNPVQYATDKVESTGKRGTVAAADGMRRVAGAAAQNRPAAGTPGISRDLYPSPGDHLGTTHLNGPKTHDGAGQTAVCPKASVRSGKEYRSQATPIDYANSIWIGWHFSICIRATQG